MSDLPCFLGIDLGGTNIKAGVVDDAGRTVSHVSIPTEADRGPDHGVERMILAGRQAVDASSAALDEIAAVGLATPGTMDIPAGILLEPHNLPGWTNIEIRRIIREALGRPTVLQNDANAAAYGEYWIGAGRDAGSMVFWTLGTGLGCGIIVHDMIIEGAHSHGSECGHMIVQMDGGRYCTSRHYGELEAYVSATALIEQCRNALTEGAPSLVTELVDDVRDVNPRVMAQAAEQGDALCRDLIMEASRCLGVGTTTLMHTINPEIVLLGGAMTFGRNETALGRDFLGRLREEVSIRAFPVPYENTVIDYASLGGDAGYIGAAGWARRQFYANEIPT